MVRTGHFFFARSTASIFRRTMLLLAATAAIAVITWLLLPIVRRILRFGGYFVPRNHKANVVVRFGVLGVARITPRALVWPCAWTTQADIVCIAARDPIRAAEFAHKYEIPNITTTYDAVLENAQVNAVYIPLPNGLHFE